MINPVEEHLKINDKKILSLRVLSKELNLKKKQIDYFVHNSNNIRNCEPIEVGSGRYKLNIYTYKIN